MLILPKKLRKKLKEPFGRLYPSPKEALIPEGAFIISVGDVTTHRLLQTGLKPHLAIIDNRVQRKTSKYKIRYDAKILKCENPPGTITDELWTIIKEAIKSGDNHLIIVDGEEDLAVLPSIILAPTDAIILYGQPNEGVVLVKAEKMKQKAENLIREFKEVKADGDQNNR
ncbi:MAG TPA: DUF359 domain-containing protein [Methanobacteriales archaeon]|nr:MAG: hypothetical protein XD44_0072 [Methanobacteriaceae archaeon 41_258]MBC7090126.1 GTP-dependent dephospho-CoA kinase family protein [Methanobacteriaceae archaeon]MBC7096255.1 GTP-dependent dephospho-CoA kinase family protein [Methanobacteriales archaeon]HIH61826.1 DUF359 domain-containing protein [Methanobacteriales archaeon]